MELCTIDILLYFRVLGHALCVGLQIIWLETALVLLTVAQATGMVVYLFFLLIILVAGYMLNRGLVCGCSFIL